MQETRWKMQSHGELEDLRNDVGEWLSKNGNKGRPSAYINW